MGLEIYLSLVDTLVFWKKIYHLKKCIKYFEKYFKSKINRVETLNFQNWKETNVDHFFRNNEILMRIQWSIWFPFMV